MWRKLRNRRGARTDKGNSPGTEREYSEDRSKVVVGGVEIEVVVVRKRFRELRQPTTSGAMVERQDTQAIMEKKDEWKGRVAVAKPG